jgi:type IV secretory pathway TraG/TraD family ATPase VirD4
VSTANRRDRPAGANPDLAGQLMLAGSLLVLAGVGAVTGAVHAGNALTDDPVDLPANPIALVLGLARGEVVWPGPATWLLAAAGVLLIALAATVVVLVTRARGRRSRVDPAAARMGRGRDLAALTARGAAATATRLGVPEPEKFPGLPLGVSVAGGQTLYSSWEDVTIDIWGPRTGKTTARAIPAILAAPGPVLATSNKRDLLDATRSIRATTGTTWVFDPQSIADEPASWWWNPLSYVTDEIKAASLAKLFATASREPGARTDAYFDKAAVNLLANLLLAAAVSGQPITQVYLWLTDPGDDRPVDTLKHAGYDLPAAALQGILDAPEKQRGGVYGTALEVVSFLTNRAATAWVTPAGAARAEFDPHAFARSADTLYLLSKEGEGTTGPLVTALTVAVCEAAEHVARRSTQGRLPIPLVAVLDEAANVCRWHNLPDLYSHYGSRGITIMTILQSWSQGVEVWGRDGMRKLWSAANIKIYGGGVSETEFLGELSQLVGDQDVDTVSTTRSHGRTGSRSINRQLRRERVLDPADLAALPRGRALVFSSGAPASLMRTRPWMDSPQADRVAASVHAHDPASQPAAVRT